MPTALDPNAAVSTGLLGATGPVQVTLGPCSVDYFDYTKKDGTVVARTVAALISMSPEGDVDNEGNPRSYQQMYSIGDPKSHHPNPDKATFEGQLVKGTNFVFFLESLINAGFPQHLLVDAGGDVRVLNGVVAVVEQKQPPKRNMQQVPGQEDKSNKPVVVPIKVIHPTPTEEWPLTGKPVATKAAQTGGKPAPKAKAPAKKAEAPVATQSTTTPVNGEAVDALATLVVQEIILEAGEGGYIAKDDKGGYSTLTQAALLKYLKKMQKDQTAFPPNMRGEVVKLIQNAEWLEGAERPWVFDEDSGLLVGS